MAAEGRLCSAVVRLVEGICGVNWSLGPVVFDLWPELEARPCGQNRGLETCGRDLRPELEAGTCGWDLWPELEA